MQLREVGVTPLNVTDVLASLLKGSTRPATRILQELSGQQLTLRVLRNGRRPLTSREHFRLTAGGIGNCRWRHGLLVDDDGMVAMSTTLAWLPPRLPDDACRELDEGITSAGLILERLGMHREDRRALATDCIEEITGEPAAIISSAVLVVRGMRACIAEEFITARFAYSLA